MPHIYYIETDEEIISVISRLRQSPDEENFFVFPKRALVLQSIINLRLFKREAEKLGKKIIIVTQDDAGKLLAEKAGLVTTRYTDDFAQQANHLELGNQSDQISIQVPARSTPEPVLRSNDIGSSEFFSTGRNLRIRNASPEKQTSLNSKRTLEQPLIRTQMAFQSSLREAPTTMTINRAFPKTPQPSPSRPLSGMPGEQTDTRSVMLSEREQRLRSFFSPMEADANKPRGILENPKRPSPLPTPEGAASFPTAPASHKVRTILFFLGGISFLSCIGVGIFLFLPKAEIHVTPYRLTEERDIQLRGSIATSADTSAENVPLRLIEKEEMVNFSVPTTGVSQGAAQKARGTIVISNAFSSDPQPLVATTRFATSDGKIFRLVSGVTVPGMSGTQPGTIEAAVIADQTGSDYNINASDFTIPGFQSGPKYEKITAHSAKAMSGGSQGNGGGQSSISKNDLDKATTEARKQASDTFLSAVSGELLPGEKILGDNLDIVAIGDPSLPLNGTVATSFTYESKFRVRGFVVSEDSIKQQLLSQGNKTLSGVTFQPVSVVLTYGSVVPDFDKETALIHAHASIASESVIDREKFLVAIMGKDSQAINSLLGAFPEIKKIEISFKPAGITTTVPTMRNRVMLLIEPGEE